MAIKTALSPKATILIVEDVILAAICLRDAFEDAGYRVMDLTTRHREALSAALAEKPDIALVNIQLQGRDDGIGVARDFHAIGIGQQGAIRADRGDRLPAQAL
jgi:CheY-like chemotaxis protein